MTEAALFDLPAAPAGRPRSRVLPQVRAAVKAADHLTPADAALVQLAMRLAADIDRCALGDKVAATFQAQLLGVLKEAGLTPRQRRLDGLDDASTDDGGDLLDQLSAIRMARKRAAADSGP